MSILGKSVYTQRLNPKEQWRKRTVTLHVLDDHSAISSSVSRSASNAVFLRLAKTFLIMKATVAVPTITPATPHPTATAKAGDVIRGYPSCRILESTTFH